jgi:hypothetical protein
MSQAPDAAIAWLPAQQEEVLMSPFYRSVIDPTGVFRLSFVDPEFRSRPDPEGIFKVLGGSTLAA